MESAKRRKFLKTASVATAGFFIAGPVQAKEEVLSVGVIGPGGMGSNHLSLLVKRKDVRVDYVCDADKGRLEAAAKSVKAATGVEPKAVQDMRQVYDDKNVAAVWIATPDHWHGPATILACDAGKHVYVEKPCSHNIREGRLMVDAARRNKRIVQVGTQARSSSHAIEAMKRIKDGAIGEVLVAKAWNSQIRRNIGKTKTSQPPASLDYDLWIGPAPMRPYQSNMLPGIWRWWLDFGTGDAGNDGVHDIDLARWGLGVNTHPSKVAAIGGKSFFDDDQQFPDTMYCVFEYPGASKAGKSRQLIFEQRIWSPYVQEGHENGNAFYGTQGMIILGKGAGWQMFGPKNKLIEEMKGKFDLPAHQQNFLDCVRSGNVPNAEIAEGHLSAALAHLGNTACLIGQGFDFSPEQEKVTNLVQADVRVKRQYREGGHWAVPKGV
ncbi:MAG: Gfo/Idh/MocA family oxidoreductase [Gemmataceae bacterium]|nr:Gfo/Idh/MocA family oxidoreductase [Gemmataceae bacterium]